MVSFPQLDRHFLIFAILFYDRPDETQVGVSAADRNEFDYYRLMNGRILPTSPQCLCVKEIDIGMSSLLQRSGTRRRLYNKIKIGQLRANQAQYIIP
jgi:hypothetical protein